ncbi:MAG: restriction endonuclease subunit S [Nitrospira sp.]|nr:restriction endonuclease subunit S [Nitrospira sp.]
MSAPATISRHRLKYLSTINDENLDENTNSDFEMQYIDIGNVDSSGRIDGLVSYRFEEAPSRARRRVRDGDVIISTVRRYLQAIARIDNPPDSLIISTGFAVVRPLRNKFDANYCRFALREPAFLAEVEKRSVGVNYPTINVSDLANIPVHIHPLPQQRAIADYLDRETARLDALVAAKERLLELIAEKRQAIITHAVTRGLDLHAPLRDSGIPWIGQIPAHWEIERARWLFHERDQRSETGDEELLTVSHLTGVTPRTEKEVYMFEAETKEGYKICRKGDLVINTLWAWMGAMGVTSVNGIVSPAYNVYEATELLDPAYVDALVRISMLAQEATRFSKGVWSSRLRLYPEGFFEIFLPVPPLPEQQQIVALLKTETQKLDNLQAMTESTIALLKERRSAIIASAVTGQIAIGSTA